MVSSSPLREAIVKDLVIQRNVKAGNDPRLQPLIGSCNPGVGSRMVGGNRDVHYGGKCTHQCYLIVQDILCKGDFGRLCRPLRGLWSVIHSVSQSLTQWSRLHIFLHVIFNYDVPAATFIVALNMMGSRPFTRILCWFHLYLAAYYILWSLLMASLYY